MQNLLKVSDILTIIPDSLKEELFDSYNKIHQNYLQGRWEPSELNGGKICEVVYTILRGYVDGSFPSIASKPPNMVDACRALEQAPSSSFPRSIRIQIPRMIIALYEIRNNRGVGHVGGDVNPNHMDANVVLYMSKWIIAELVRVFHQVDTETASDMVDSIVDRLFPVIWIVDNKHRVLDTTLSMTDKALIILYSFKGSVSDTELFEWIEYSNLSVFRKNILEKAHNHKLIEYNKDNQTVQISPKGIRYVEENIDLSF